MPHLVVSISGHGYGHIAQTAPVLNQLRNLMPQLRLTVRSSAPVKQLRARILAPFTHLPGTDDTGMAMTSALHVDVAASRALYRTFHTGWDKKIAQEAKILQELGADLVFSNVGYLPLAGAQRANIPCAAFCSLNWHDIYRHYCHSDPADLAISAEIHSCYSGADAFFRATPGMNMSGLANLICVAPTAETGQNRRDEINRILQLPAGTRLVLVSMGGISNPLPIDEWPSLEGVRYLTQQSSARAIDFETLPMSFSDLLASSDALLCKPGYGSFVEAACSGVPVLYTARPDWPESPALIEWLQQNGVGAPISPYQLISGDFSEAMQQIWQAEKPQPPAPDGAKQVARWLAEHLT